MKYKKTIATSGGIEAVARAMTIHADNDGVQERAVYAITNMVGNIPAHIAMAKAAGVVPLLQRAAGQGNEDAAKQLKRMGACPGYQRSGMFSSKCKKCGMAKDAH
jgi:hypothetical protein